MTIPRISVIIPHKSTPENDKSLSINVSKLLEGAWNSVELIIDTTTPKDPYRIWNEAAFSARGDYLVFSNSDVIMAPGWDVPFINHTTFNSIVVGYLVEPGNIYPAAVNIHEDFGKTPDTFDYHKFVEFVARHSQKVPDLKMERGWYMPCCVRKDWFQSTGGFNTDLPFPNPNDILFWNRCVKEYGTELRRVRSYAYHFQNLSGR